jgi:CRISPR/Cas system-associated protein Cas10 (large subunit of type III CRISPR-Cas system)
MSILVFDVGENIIGVQNTNGGRYIPYRGEKRINAIERLEKAHEIVTYNGNLYDLKKVNELSHSLRGFSFTPPKKHTDIREEYWPNIWGSNLYNTFKENIKKSREFPDTYEGSNQADVYMTLMLWKKLKTLNKHKDAP